VKEDGSLTGWKTYVSKFHTKNKFSDVSPTNKTFLRRGKKLHHQDTPYFIDVCKTSSDTSFLTLDQVKVKDLTLENIIEDYTAEEVENVFSFFNTLVDGKASRDAIDSSGYYQTSGGARDYYLEKWGGSYVGADTDSILPNVSGVLYEIDDD
jgi:hypothetical protein